VRRSVDLDIARETWQYNQDRSEMNR